ncbi:hypothetical protein BDW75DRAFT_222046 [Aspergillus navahoensis]
MSIRDPNNGAASDTDVALLPWDEIYRKACLSSNVRSSLWKNDENPLAMSQVNSVLSAASYFYPEPHGSSGEPEPSLLQVYGGTLLDNTQRSPTLPSDGAHPKSDQQPVKLSGNASVSTKRSLKSRGRPRKTAASPQGENPDERRRTQIRLAQRAYRSRKEANVSFLKNRLSLLETALEKISSSVLSFSGEVILSGALKTHPNLTYPLRDTVQTCLTLVKEATSDNADQETLEALPQSEESFSSSAADTATYLSPGIPRDRVMTSTPTTDAVWNLADIEWPKDLPGIPADMSHMDVSVFIERLLFTCLYQGFLALADQSIPTTRLEAPFRLLLSRMDRNRILSYFSAALHARVTQQRLEEWADIPFFSLGGAGTHYPRPTSSIPSTIVRDPLAAFSTAIKEELDGDWFDIQDLEGYLREKRVHLRESPPVSKRRSPAQASVNVARLLPALVNKAVCLGGTPGFRRRDVDKALLSAVWT